MYTYLAVFSAAIVSPYLPSPKRMDNITKELKRYTHNRVGVGFSVAERCISNKCWRTLQAFWSFLEGHSPHTHTRLFFLLCCRFRGYATLLESSHSCWMNGRTKRGLFYFLFLAKMISELEGRGSLCISARPSQVVHNERRAERQVKTTTMAAAKSRARTHDEVVVGRR